MDDQPYTGLSALIFRAALALSGTVILFLLVAKLAGTLTPLDEIAYQAGNTTSAVWLIDIGNSTQHQIHQRGYTDFYGMSWSPEGDRLAVSRAADESSNEDVLLITPHSGDRQALNVTQHPERDYAPAWLNSDQIVFWSNRNNGNRTLYALDLEDPANTLEILMGPLTPNADSKFTWSPRGQEYAMVSYRHGEPEIYVRALDQTQSQRLTETDNAILDDAPAWSPDGSRIAFWSNRDSTMRLYVMNSDGSNVQPVSTLFPEAHETGWSITWSPDGSMLAFTANFEGLYAVYTIHPDGTGLRRVRFIETGGEPITLTSVAWRPSADQ